MGDPTYELLADLDGDGTPETDVLPDVRTASALLTARGLDGERIISPPSAGIMRAAADNRAGQYGPGSGFVRGRSITLRETGGFDSTPRNLWSGLLDEPRRVRRELDAVVRFTAYGNLARIAGKRVATPLLEDARTDECLHALFDALEIDPALRNFDSGLTTLRQWWLGDRNGPEDAWRALLALLYTEGPGAQIYEAPDGRIRFRNRHSLVLDPRSTDVQGHFKDNAQPSPSELEYDDGRLNVFNFAEIAVVRRAEASLAVVWELGDTIELQPGEIRTFPATSDNGDPMKSAVTPSEGAGDFTVTAGSIVDVDLPHDSGGIIPITLTAGIGGATVTGLRLRAVRLPVSSSTVVQSQNVDTSTLEELKPWDRPIRAEIAPLVAQDIANAIPSWYLNGRPRAALLLKGDDPAKLAQQLSREVGDRIAITDQLTELVGDEFYVLHIEQELEHGRFLLVTKVVVEQALANVYATWGGATWGGAVWGW
jgi:hypothetical protein